MASTTLSLRENQILQIGKCKTAGDGRRKLNLMYAEPSTANRMRLYEKLLTFWFQKKQDARHHIQELEWTHTHHLGIGVANDDVVYELSMMRS